MAMQALPSPDIALSDALLVLIKDGKHIDAIRLVKTTYECSIMDAKTTFEWFLNGVAAEIRAKKNETRAGLT